MNKRIEEWIRQHVPHCSEAEVSEIRSSDASGLSGETYVVVLDNHGAYSAPSKLVLRKDVQENQTNPQSNFSSLILAQTALGNLGTLQVPRILGLEESADVLGAPFAVMEFIEGEIPADVPSYAESGFVKDASVEERRSMWRSGLDFLARLHKVDFRAAGLERLRFAEPGTTEVERCVHHAVAMFRAEAGTRSTDICEEAISWLTKNIPIDSPVSICWGDARIGNMIWQDYKCVGVIDWEMSSLGSPGVDLGWWSFFHRWSTYGQGHPDLEGMPVGRDLADLYETCGGTRIDNFVYFEILGAVRGLSIWLRMYEAMSAAGVLPDGIDPLDESIHMIRVLHSLMDDERRLSYIR